MARCASSIALLVAVIAAPSGFAQSIPSAPPASSSTTAQTASHQSAQSAPATLKASSQLVIVDVVVTDNNRRSVHGLTAADFILTEDGAPQSVKNFEETSALSAADATKFAPMPTLPHGIFTNYTPAPASGSVDLILLDTLNTPMRDQSYVHQQLLAYLKSVPPGTRVAIFGLTTHLYILQGFTSDTELLKMALEKKLAQGSPLLDDAVGGGGIQNSQADDLEDLGVDPGVVANLRQFNTEQANFALQMRAQYTLDAMSQIAHYLSNIPGRKNLIWFSGSFPLDILPDASGDIPNPFVAISSSEDEFRDTVALLARSRVAVYPVDARGLTVSPMMNASSSRSYSGKSGTARMNQDQTNFFNKTAEEHGTMNAMADATGGRSFINTNDLRKAVATAIDEGSNFYTLAYTPTNSTRDGRLRKIKVQLDRPGLKLSYRKGYYSDIFEKTVPDSTKPESSFAAAHGLTSPEALHLAMTRGAPTPSDILMKVGVVAITPPTQTEDKPAIGNAPAAKTKGPYRRYSVNYAIDPNNIVFLRNADGKIHADLDLIIFVYNAAGETMNTLGNTIHLAATMDQVKKIFAEGIYQHEEISTPAKGEYFLRIAVHDLHRDYYGAVEVATSQVKNVALTPPSPPSLTTK